jgi:hypothetical protein
MGLGFDPRQSDFRVHASNHWVMFPFHIGFLLFQRCSFERARGIDCELNEIRVIFSLLF